MVESYLAFMKTKGWKFFMSYGPQKSVSANLEHIFKVRGHAVVLDVVSRWDLNLNKDDKE
jgi:hypothetical protein